MPLTPDEGFVDAIAAYQLFAKIKTAVEALPPKADRKLTDYATAFGIPVESPLYATLQLVQKIEDDVAS